MRWSKGWGLLPVLGMAVGCGGVAGVTEPVDVPGEGWVTPLEQGLEGCREVTSYEDSEVSVVDDTFVSADSPDTPGGSSTKLVSDGNPRQEAYLRFVVSQHSGFIRARLRLHVLDGTSNGPALHATSAAWTSGGLTWNTRPAPVGGALANVGALLSDSVVEYDVTGHVTGPGQYGFVLLPEVGDGADFSSLEQGANRPRLVFTYEHTRTECATQGTGGGLLGVKKAGGPNSEAPSAMATDPTGGYVIVGGVGDQGTFGGPASNADGLLVTRFRSDGVHQWSRSFPQATAGLSVSGVVITPEGNLLMAGVFSGGPDFGQGPLPGTGPGASGVFILKLSPTGQYVWAKAFRAHVDRDGVRQYLPIQANGVATDAQGSLILTGAFRGVTDFGGGGVDAGDASRRATRPTSAMYLVKFAWDGSHLWSHAHPAGESGTEGLSVTTDSQGNVVVGGAAGDGNALGASGPRTPFVSRYSPSGRLQWVRRLEGGGAVGAVTGVAMLPGDAVGFSAQVEGTFQFAGGTVQANRGGKDLVLGAMQSNSADRWVRVYGGTEGEYPTRLVADAQGNLVTMGVFQVSSDLGGGPLNPRGGELKAFVAKYGADGSHRWSRAMDDVLNPVLLGVTPLGDTLFGGDFSGPLELGGQVYAPSGSSDLLLMRLAP